MGGWNTALLAAALATAAILLALAATLAAWTVSLSRALRRRGDVPADHRLPEPLPLAPHVRADLAPPRRVRDDVNDANAAAKD